jgi:adenosylhomocysteine nucleosidase
VIKQFSILLFILSFNVCFAAQEAQTENTAPQPVIGILIPMPEESTVIQPSISNAKTLTIKGVSYTTGLMEGKIVVFMNTGIGKTNAAVFTARLINDFNPDFMLMLGTAGNINPVLKKGTVVIGKEIIDADFGQLSPSGTVFPYPQYLKSPQTQQQLPLSYHLNQNLINLSQNVMQDKTLPIVPLLV